MKSLVALLTIGIVACGSDKSKPSAGSAGSGSAQPAASAGLGVYVDDVQVGSLAAEQVKLWPRLDTLVPVAARRLGTWDAIKLTIAGKAPVTIAKPSGNYPQLVPAIFPGDDGKAAFGMFDPVELAKRGAPTLREHGITEVRIALSKGSGRGENDHGGGGASDPAKLALAIKTTGAEKIIEGTQLLELPREAPPGDADGKGWKLSMLLAHAGVTQYERLLLTDEKGTNLTLEKQDLDDRVAVPFVKLNRQGSLRFRVYRKQGESWQPSSDLRGLASVEVLK